MVKDTLVQLFIRTLKSIKVKTKFRLFKKIVEDYYEEKWHSTELIDEKDRTKMLFNNITDEEIDNLFTI